jgi:hypothetical protein
MKPREMRVGHIVKSIASVGALLAVIVGAHTDSRANGCQGPCAAAACLVETTSSLGQSKITGTITAVITNQIGVAGDVDASARLQWQGKERVYRQHLTGVPITSAEDLTCLVLAADPTADDTGLTLSQIVVVPTSSFKLNSRSVTGLNFFPVEGAAATTSSGIAEVTIYIVKP